MVIIIPHRTCLRIRLPFCPISPRFYDHFRVFRSCSGVLISFDYHFRHRACIHSCVLFFPHSLFFSHPYRFPFFSSSFLLVFRSCSVVVIFIDCHLRHHGCLHNILFFLLLLFILLIIFLLFLFFCFFFSLFFRSCSVVVIFIWLSLPPPWMPPSFVRSLGVLLFLRFQEEPSMWIFSLRRHCAKIIWTQQWGR